MHVHFPCDTFDYAARAINLIHHVVVVSIVVVVIVVVIVVGTQKEPEARLLNDRTAASEEPWLAANGDSRW